MKRIVLAYSGATETTTAIGWLAQKYGADVVTVTLDLGQSGELEAVRDRALAAGAARAHVLDVRDEFGRDFVGPALKAGALPEHGVSSPVLASAVIAEKLLAIATIEQSTAVAHATTGGGRMRLEAAIASLQPSLTVLAPACEWSTEPVPSRDEPCDDPPPDEDPQPAKLVPVRAIWPGEPAHVEVRFDRGAPVAINGIDMSLADLLATFGTIATAHGVRRSVTGVLQTAHAELQALALTPDAARFAQVVSREYADLVRAGRWFTPLRRALDAFVAHIQEPVVGHVRLKLFNRDIETAVHHLPVPARLTVVPA